jgi:hypothetical protein
MRHGLRVRSYSTKFARFSFGQKSAKTLAETKAITAQAIKTVDALRFLWPLQGIPQSPRPPSLAFGYKRTTTATPHPHGGIDIMAAAGTIVLAAADGKVRVAKAIPLSFKRGGPGMLLVNHGSDDSGYWQTQCFHVDPTSFAEFGIKNGTSVKRGDPVCRVGFLQSGSHLHFETMLDGIKVNPELYFGDITLKTIPPVADQPSETVKENERLGVDSINNRRLLVRWALIVDHWFQHNLEYLTGTFSTRAFPEIRVGYRLDIKERNESYYVEGVNHSWSYPNAMQSTFTVSRGQRNNPFPIHVLPGSEHFGGMRGKTGSRLAEFFHVMDTSATERATGDRKDIPEDGMNLVDTPIMQLWAQKQQGYIASDSSAPDDQLATTSSTPYLDLKKGDVGGGKNV